MRRSVAALWLLAAMPAQRIEHLGVDLSRIRLPRDGVGRIETHLLRDKLLKLPHLVVIAVEELQKTRLRAGRAFHAAGLQRRNPMLHFRQIERQIIRPQTRPPANRRRLSRLQMRKTERRQVAILLERNRPAQ